MSFKHTLSLLGFSPKTLTNFKGYWAEKYVKLWFCCKGYTLLQHRWLHRGGEIDLVFSKNTTLIFVEVKFRTQKQHLGHALSECQHQRIKRGALVFQQRYSAYKEFDLRFDVVWLSFKTWPVHLKNVW